MTIAALKMLMVWLVSSFIEVTPIFEVQFPEDAYLYKEIQHAENACTTDMRTFLYEVTWLEEMHILQALEYFYSLFCHTFSVGLQQEFYIHNWDLVSNIGENIRILCAMSK